MKKITSLKLWKNREEKVDIPKNLIMNIVGCIIAGGSIAGCGIGGISYFASLCGNGFASLFTILIMGVFMKISFIPVEIAKYVAIMAAVYVITKLISYVKIQMTGYGYGVIAGVIVTMMEYGTKFLEMEKMKFEFTKTALANLGTPILYGIVTAALTVIIYKITESIKDGRVVLENEDMLSLAVVTGLFMYSIYINKFVPIAAAELLTFLYIMFSAYKYGAAMGAISGAACGIPLCVSENNAEILGIMCLMGIVAGIFRELGRFACAFMVICTGITTGIILIPFFIENTTVKALLAGGFVFLCIPSGILYRIEEMMDDGNGRNVEGICEEKLMNVSRAFEKLSKSINNIAIPPQGEEDTDSEVSRMNKMWKNRLLESRQTMSKQLEQMAQIIKEYTSQVYNFVYISTRTEEYIRHRLGGSKVKMTKIAGIENRRHKTEYLITAKCEKGVTVGTREVADILSDAVGKEYMPSRNCRKVLSKDYTTTSYVEKANFYVLHGAAGKAKGDNGISGDSYSFQELENGQTVMSLSDGMGFGMGACLESETVIELLEQLLDSGFDEDTALKMINSVMLMNSREEHPATLDFGIIDLHSGVCDLVKIGAAATFVKRGKWVEMVKSTSMPLGMFEDVDYDITTKKLYGGDMVIMISDGVLDALSCENKDERLSEIIMGIKGTNPKEIANEILNKAVTDKSKMTDDMTVLVTGIWDSIAS